MLYISNPQPYDPKASAANVPQKILLLDRDRPANVRHCLVPSRVPVDSWLNFGVTDRFAYWNDDPGNVSSPLPVLYRWPLCDYPGATVLPITPWNSFMTVLSDRLFLFRPPDGNVVLYRPDGSVERRFRLKLGKHGAASALLSRNGARLAVDAITQRGGFPLFDIGTHVTKERLILVSAKDADRLASVPVKPVDRMNAFVLSPDGTRAAVLTWSSTEEVLTIVTVPRRRGPARTYPTRGRPPTS